MTARPPHHRRRARGPGRRAGGRPADRRVPPGQGGEAVPEAVLPARGPEAAARQARDVLPHQAAELGRPVPPDQPPHGDLPVQPEAAARRGAPQEELGADPLPRVGPLQAPHGRVDRRRRPQVPLPHDRAVGAAGRRAKLCGGWARRSRGQPCERQESARRCSTFGRTGSPGSSTSPRAEPQGLEHLGRKSAKRAHWHASFHFRRRQQRPPRGTGNRPPPGSADRREGADTGHPNGVERTRSCGQRDAQRHDDTGGWSSVVRARARRAC